MAPAPTHAFQLRFVVRILLGIAALAITAAALHHLWRTFSVFSLTDFQKAVALISPLRLMLAAGLIIAAYSIMTGYDTFGLRLAGSSLPWKKIAVVSFVGDCFNANLGFSAAAGSVVKLRLYRRYGVNAGIVARAIAAYTLAYWAGFFFLLGISSMIGLLFGAKASSVPHFGFLPAAAGFGLAVGALYLILCFSPLSRLLPAALLGAIPRGGPGFKLLCIGVADWLCCGSAFFILMPELSIRDFPAFMSAFLFAHCAGVVSQSPGGIGVFESALLLLNRCGSLISLGGAFLVFRALYYLAPFTLAVVVFCIGEIRHRWGRLRKRGSAGEIPPARGTSAVRDLPPISIVVPAHNEESSLPACLHALSNQDYAGPYEIVVVDNASTDSTAAIAQSFGCRVIHEPVKGYARAVARGFDEARGDIIACTDADTIVERRWLARITALLSRENVVGCGGVFRFHDGPLWVRILGAVFGRLNYHIAGANMAVWKYAYQQAGGFALGINLGADVDLSIRLKKIGSVIIDRSLVVATSSRRFASAFWETLVRYYCNDLWLFLFRKPLFRSFADYRSLRPAAGTGAWWMMPAAIVFACMFFAGWQLQWPSSSISGTAFAKGGSTNAIALTFDDGPGQSTNDILNVLRTFDAKATFFVIGKNARMHPNLLKRIRSEGHEIGNHSFRHLTRTLVELPQTFAAELDSASRIIREITGIAPVLFRPPHGWRRPWIKQECRQKGYQVVFWNVDSEDWRVKRASHIAHQVFRQVRPGAIILLHDRLNTGADSGMPATVEALPAILDSLSRAGYTFVTVSELIAMQQDTVVSSPLTGARNDEAGGRSPRKG